MSKVKAEIEKINLDILTKLVDELKVSLETADTLKNNHTDYVVELSKAMGLCTGIMTESTMLIGDIQQLAIKMPTVASSADLITKLISPLKGNSN